MTKRAVFRFDTALRQQLATADPAQLPEGVSKANWQRIVVQSHEAWTQSTDLEADWFAELGPFLRPGEVAVLLDGVIVKGRPKGSRLEEYTARIATSDGFWYVTGRGPPSNVKSWPRCGGSRPRLNA